jgi:hypothetical protein
LRELLPVSPSLAAKTRRSLASPYRVGSKRATRKNLAGAAKNIGALAERPGKWPNRCASQARRSARTVDPRREG